MAVQETREALSMPPGQGGQVFLICLLLFNGFVKVPDGAYENRL